MKRDVGSPWLLFVLVDAGSRSANRVRVWRALKSLGPAIVRDGVYLVPHLTQLEVALHERRAEVRSSGGDAYVFRAVVSDTDDVALRALFDRSAAFATLARAAQDLDTDGDFARNEAEARRALRSLQREYATLVATDYFPDGRGEVARAALGAAERALLDRFSPGEPRSVRAEIFRCDRSAFQGRRWATRERLWVDRLASAWLIRRFIDPHATFVWLADPRDLPPDAVGFDFDGATFTHVGDAVTFEVLVRSFDLVRDVGLTRIADMVRSLDIPGSPRNAEAAGFEAMLDGAREQSAGDDALVQALSPPLDFLYTAFRRDARKHADAKTEGSDAT